jgi:hypothetical protein
VGTIANFRIEGNKVKGDLTLLKNSPNRAFVLEIAQTLADQFGLSIAFKPTFEKIGGLDYVRADEIYSADIVDAPAANKDGLFDSSPVVGGPLANTSTAIPTGVKPKTRTINVRPPRNASKCSLPAFCPNCEAHMETFSKLATLHDSAANKLSDYVDSLSQKDNVSSISTETQFAARLEAQRIELTEQFEKQASITACRMLAKTGIQLSKIPSADVCLASGSGGILDQMNAIADPTAQGLFYQANKDAVNAAFSKRAAKNVANYNQVRAEQ